MSFYQPFSLLQAKGCAMPTSTKKLAFNFSPTTFSLHMFVNMEITISRIHAISTECFLGYPKKRVVSCRVDSFKNKFYFVHYSLPPNILLTRKYSSYSSLDNLFLDIFMFFACFLLRVHRLFCMCACYAFSSPLSRPFHFLHFSCPFVSEEKLHFVDMDNVFNAWIQLFMTTCWSHRMHNYYNSFIIL